MTIINRTCRWCNEPLSSGKKVTGLCRKCLDQYVQMVTDIEHSDVQKILNQKNYAKDKCKNILDDGTECGNKKDKRAKQCMKCYDIKRNIQIRELGKRSYKGRRRKDSTYGTMPPSDGGRTVGEYRANEHLNKPSRI